MTYKKAVPGLKNELEIVGVGERDRRRNIQGRRIDVLSKEQIEIVIHTLVLAFRFAAARYFLARAIACYILWPLMEKGKPSQTARPTDYPLATAYLFPA
jgi:hypothetical protein